MHESFGNKSQKVFVSKDEVKISRMKIFKELKGYGVYIFFATLGATVLGVLTPTNGYVLAHSMNALNCIFYY